MRAGRFRLRMVVGEEAPPGLIHGAGIGEVTLVKLVNEPLIGAEIGLRACAVARRAGWRLPGAGWRLNEIRGPARGLSRHGGHRPLPVLYWQLIAHTKATCRPLQGRHAVQLRRRVPLSPTRAFLGPRLTSQRPTARALPPAPTACAIPRPGSLAQPGMPSPPFAPSHLTTRPCATILDA